MEHRGISTGGYNVYHSKPQPQQQERYPQEQYQQQYQQYYSQPQRGHPQHHYEQQHAYQQQQQTYQYQQHQEAQRRQLQQQQVHQQYHPQQQQAQYQQELRQAQHQQLEGGGQYRAQQHHHRGPLGSIGHHFSRHRQGAGSPTPNATDRIGGGPDAGGEGGGGRAPPAPAALGEPLVSDAEQKKRKKKGLCPTCCVRLEKISTITRKRTKVTNRAEGVVSGTCLKCKGITDGYNTRTGQPAAFFDNAADGERGG
eukprot:CAMPEP_0113600978 /NCGR_PEP_ID=MMETSP0015_2-20120614/42988_1 /TAXON_ID=2838 /ORGANISM="Odontella" /LENGTH=253 /DNA_ID=CAMNT_0000509257 /DNA_START=234 /DNA_END=992 /DNA_ORIENTATION=+ /assembly_acc=CAM_ASM_000160